jgi:hypothetical protein
MNKRGRPKLNDAQREILQVRVVPDIKRDFEKASRLSGLSLSSWARERLMAAARKELQNLAQKSDIAH